MTNLKKLLTLLTILLINILLISCSSNSSNNNLKIHYIDVGQGDAILIQVNNKNLLIDAGPSTSQENLVSYLKDNKVKTLDYIIATHPHEDHIGGMANVISNFHIGKFYAPNIIHSSKAFENMIIELQKKKLKVNIIKRGIGHDLDLGKNATLEVFSPISNNYDNINNYSPIMKITYGSNSFLFTGDAEKEVEEELIKNKDNIASNVLKLGHHGSSSSTSEIFFNLVSPNISVISLGIDNSYGHPNKKILELLNSKNTAIYRTDEDGSIVISSDGSNITIE